MAETKLLTLGGISLPLDIEAMESLPVPGGKIHFDFVYRDIPFTANYDETGDSAVMQLAGIVGPLPFTAESPPARSGLSLIVAEANDVLGGGFAVDGGRIVLQGELPIIRPVTATKVIAAAAAMLLPAAPYLDMIATYVRPPQEEGKPGESSVRPEWRRRLQAKR